MSLLPAAIGIILNSNQKEVLLVKRRDIPIWVLPGGGIECHERIEEALKREIYEETGYHVRLIRQAAEYDPINRLAAKTSLFICEVESGNPSPSSETTEIAFYPLDALPYFFFPLHAGWLTEACSSSSIIKRPLTEVTYGKLLTYLLRHPVWILQYAWTRFYSHYFKN